MVVESDFAKLHLRVLLEESPSNDTTSELTWEALVDARLRLSVATNIDEINASLQVVDPSKNEISKAKVTRVLVYNLLVEYLTKTFIVYIRLLPDEDQKLFRVDQNYSRIYRTILAVFGFTSDENYRSLNNALEALTKKKLTPDSLRSIIQLSLVNCKESTKAHHVTVANARDAYTKVMEPRLLYDDIKARLEVHGYVDIATSLSVKDGNDSGFNMTHVAVSQLDIGKKKDNPVVLGIDNALSPELLASALNLWSLTLPGMASNSTTT
jgi:hypothetical protein